MAKVMVKMSRAEGQKVLGEISQKKMDQENKILLILSIFTLMHKEKHLCCHVGTTEILLALKSTSVLVAAHPVFGNGPFNLR